MVDSYATAYVYSNQLLASKTNKINHLKLKEFGGFALEYEEGFRKEMEQRKELAIDASKKTLSSLKWSVPEIETIAKTMNDADLYTNERATRGNFLLHAANYRILHLSMHSIMTKDYTLNSSIIFYKTPNAKYIVTAADIYTLPINADMVVLNACSTGDGLIQKGAEIRNFVRAFLYAGAKSVVANLWDADDGATKGIMVDYNKYLQEGKPKDIAMQMAQKNYLKKGNETNPKKWAHLIVVGDTAPLYPTSYCNFFLGIACLLLVLILLVVWRKRRNLHQ